ncbi:hypothetical protein RTG_00147 [Rhodotorula toruloides ATCC 204091]|uniref:BTB domain-containing protein n=1 Tax=Rhodotorula toruloides TaxID=5286 RepID=A0A0K3CJ19_RHOTO|nr:hypothetical protein RTG_00147 [Rhodotorula toruloides ATCC 204091]PRQ73353.1 hypothetical protein AAT19DRAFT_16106 [Rhodotorula toruloides]
MPSTFTLSQEVTLQWPDPRELFAILMHMPACRLQQRGFPFELSFVYDFDSSRYALRWSDVQGLRITGGLVLARVGAKRIMDVALAAGTFPAYPHGALYSSNSGEQGRPSTLHIEITVTLAPPAGPPLERTLREERQLNAVSSAMHMSCQVPHDAAFVFPRSRKVLWANEQFLSAASPYFKTLFSSDFAENSTTNSFETLKSILNGAISDETRSSEDSDDETDATYELYSSLVSTYPAVRDVVLDYVVEHWSEGVESSALREMEERAGREELPDGAAQTGILLARRLTQRREK